MRFERVTVYPAFSREILVEWELEDEAQVDPGPYFFTVERSASPEGPWDCLTPKPLVDAMHFVDKLTPLLSKENFLFYRVTATLPSGKTIVSPAKDLFRNLERPQWLVWREITRKEILRLKKFVGIRAAVLKKKRFGEPCEECTDPVTGTVTDSQCRECFGTRYQGGFYPPIEAWIESSPVPDAKGLGGHGWMTEDYVGQLRMVSYPLVSREDIVVELESNRRFRVLQIDPIELRTVPVVQLVSARMISRSDVEYRIPAHLEPDDCGRNPNRDAQLTTSGKSATTVQPESVD